MNIISSEYDDAWAESLEYFTQDDEIPCPVCDGDGVIDEMWVMPDADGHVRELTCWRCKGTGLDESGEGVQLK